MPETVEENVAEGGSQMTYEEIAEQVGLERRTLGRYLEYMKSRWADSEEIKCRVGYAREWALRFKNGIEYSASDSHGRRVLFEIDGGKHHE